MRTAAVPGRDAELGGYPEAEDKKARWGSESASVLQRSMTESLRDWGLLSPPAPSPPPAVPSLAEGSRLAGYSSSESSPGERARLRETGGSWSAGGWNEKGESYSLAGEASNCGTEGSTEAEYSSGRAKDPVRGLCGSGGGRAGKYAAGAVVGRPAGCCTGIHSGWGRAETTAARGGSRGPTARGPVGCRSSRRARMDSVVSWAA